MSENSFLGRDVDLFELFIPIRLLLTHTPPRVRRSTRAGCCRTPSWGATVDLLSCSACFILLFLPNCCPACAQIHTGRMSENSFLGRDVDLFELAQRCRNFSGAEIEGLVKSAASFALNRQVDLSDLSKPIDEENLKVRPC